MFIYRFFFTLSGVSLFIMSAEFIELQRRHSDFSFSTSLILALLKTPSTIHQLFPLLIFLTTLLVFFALEQRNEFIPMRNIGLSAWKLLSPFLAVSFVLGSMNLVLLQPFSIFTFKTFSLQEAKKIDQNSEDTFRVFSSGIWIKQKTKNGYALAHMTKAAPSNFENIFYFSFSPQGSLDKSYHAKYGVHRRNIFTLKEASKYLPKKGVSFFKKKPLEEPVHLDSLLIQNFRPDFLYFWHLPRLINIAKKTNLSSHSYEIKFQKLLSSILECVALTLFAAVMGMQMHRRYGSFILFFTGSCVGFLFYFATQIAQAFCVAGHVSPFLASWLPVFFIFLSAFLLIFFFEEGQKQNY